MVLQGAAACRGCGEQICWQAQQCCCLRLSLDCSQLFISSCSQAGFGGYYSKSKSKITLLSSLPGGMDIAELTKLLHRGACAAHQEPVPSSFGEDQLIPACHGGSCTHPTVPCTRHWGSSLCSTSQGPCTGATNKLLDQQQLSWGRQIKILSSGSQDELQQYSELLFVLTLY